MEMVYWAASAVFIHVIVDYDMQLPAERVRACVRMWDSITFLFWREASSQSSLDYDAIS